MKPPRRRRKPGFNASFTRSRKGAVAGSRAESTQIEDQPSIKTEILSLDEQAAEDADRLTLSEVLPQRGKRPLPKPRTAAKPAPRAKRETTPAAARKVEDFAGRYPFTLDGFQLEAMRSLAEGNSVLVTAPTGT